MDDMDTLLDLFGPGALLVGACVVVGTLCIPELGLPLFPLVVVGLWIGVSFVSMKSKNGG